MAKLCHSRYTLAMTNWLSAPRVQLVCTLLLGVNILIVLALWLTSQGGLDFGGRPLGADFLAFWNAGWLAGNNTLPLADGTLAMSDIHPLAPSGQTDVLLWTYPPPFLLLLAPLAQLPYIPAMLTFTILSLALALLAARLLTPTRWGWLVLLSAPVTLVCVLGGQTGLLVAGSIGLGFVLRRSHPWLAGLAFSLAIIKPHFAALIPLFLLLQRDDKALISMVIGVIVLCGLSWLAFGPDAWSFFLSQMPSARLILETGAPPWAKMGSVFVTVRQLGGPLGLAWGLHLLAFTLALHWAWPVLRRADDHAVAALLLLTMLATPYQFDYDQVLTLLALGFWARARLGRFSRAEQLTLLLLWLGPVLFPMIATHTQLGLMPLPLLAGLVLLKVNLSRSAPA